MFLIKRVTDPRLAARICDSFGAPENGSFAYAATKCSARRCSSPRRAAA